MYVGKDQVLKVRKAVGIILNNTHDYFCKACIKANIYDIIPKIAN